MKLGPSPRHALAGLVAVFLVLAHGAVLAAGTTPQPPQQIPEISGGAQAYDLARDLHPDYVGPHTNMRAPLFPGAAFDAYGFDDNGTLLGTYFIPPDPIGAVGPDRVIAVVNVGIEARDKSGALLFRNSLRNFFSTTPGTLGTFCFDPKIVYDPYADRFVVVAIERWDVANGDPSNESRILLAVSRSATPASATAADWYFFAIDSKLTIGAGDTWADYPGLEVDEEAIYVTMNQFPFTGSAGSYGQRLWIVNKAPFYAGGPAAFTLHDPYGATGIAAFATTTMPAQVYGAAGAGPGIGTYLVSYSGLTYGGAGNPEALCVIRINNPLGAVSFTQEFVDLADIEDIGGVFGFPALPDAPQSGGPALIEVNDRRLLDLVWRDGNLWGCTTILPNAFDPANAGQTTAFWFQIDTSGVVSSASPPGLLITAQQGTAGGEDFAPGMFTFFPAIAVNAAGEMKLGFSGSSPGTFGSAYVAGRTPADPLNFVGPTGLVRAGVDYYLRTFGGPRNRWGDYSGIALDPADDTKFWAFNVWADLRGTPIAGQDGRWKTAWLECSFAPPAPPDLVISVFEGPCCVVWQDQIGAELFVEVKNSGLAASAATQLQLFLSTDPVIDVLDVPLPGGTLAVPPLAAGASAVLAVPPGVTIPGGFPVGDAYFGGIVDDVNVIVESDESNNTASARTVVNARPFGCMRGRAFAGLQGIVSLYTVPDGSGDRLDAAQLFTGVGSPSVPFDATIQVTVTDENGVPATGYLLDLSSVQGNLVLCAAPEAVDGPTDAAGQATFSGALHGGGAVGPGDALLVTGPAGEFIPGLVYGFPEMLASNQNGELFRVSLATGASALLCNVGPGSTEIEWNPATQEGWNQEPAAAFGGETFDWKVCGPTSGFFPTNGYVFNGLEWVDGRLVGAGIVASCGNSEMWVIDPVNGNFVPIGPTGRGPITGLAWDPVCRRLYGSIGCTNALGPSDLVEIDLTTGAATTVLNFGTQIGSIEFGPDGRLYAGGGQADGANLYAVDIPSGSVLPIGPTGIAPGVTGLALASDAGIPILVNSPDLSGDLLVDLVDLALFASAYGGPYDYRIDYSFDQVENLADLSRFAASYGAVCPAGPKVARPSTDAADAELALAFDAAGTVRSLSLDPGTSVTAYVVARGDVARAGVRAWEARIESSPNVVVETVETIDGSLDVGRDGDHVVGLTQTAQSDGGAVVLARLRVRVTDTSPASLSLHAPAVSSTGGTAPALVGVDAPEDVRAAHVTVTPEGAAATLNAEFDVATPSVVAVDLRAVPNPFNPRTNFEFTLPRSGRVQVRIFDVSGRLVRTLEGGAMDAGPRSLVWTGDDSRGRSVSSGLYFARLLVDGVETGRTEKLTLLE